jgi:hypothetical protein
MIVVVADTSPLNYLIQMNGTDGWPGEGERYVNVEQ